VGVGKKKKRLPESTIFFVWEGRKPRMEHDKRWKKKKEGGVPGKRYISRTNNNRKKKEPHPVTAIEGEKWLPSEKEGGEKTPRTPKRNKFAGKKLSYHFGKPKNKLSKGEGG